MILGNQLHMRGDKDIVTDCDTASVHESATEVDKYSLTDADISPEIGVKRRIEVEILPDCLSGDCSIVSPYRCRIADRGVHLLRQALGFRNDFFDLSVIRIVD